MIEPVSHGFSINYLRIHEKEHLEMRVYQDQVEGDETVTLYTITLIFINRLRTYFHVMLKLGSYGWHYVFLLSSKL